MPPTRTPGPPRPSRATPARPPAKRPPRPPRGASTGPIRLQRLLSQAGVAARRKAEELIVAGRVTVNGKVVRELGTKVDPERDRVAVDGEGVAVEDKFYVLLNKPKGCITAVSDDRGRPTVMDYLPNLPVSVAPVGRLDFYTEGVLLLTNDGELAARLLAPKWHVPKTYHVKIHGQITPKQLEKLREGVRLDDGTVTLPAEVAELPAESKHSWLAITIVEGKSRQIHRMLEAVGHQVTKLQRVAFANLTFHGLRVGDARELSQAEVNELRELVELPRGPTVRGRWHAEREQTDLVRRQRAAAKAEAAAAAQPQMENQKRSGTGTGTGKQDRKRDQRRSGTGTGTGQKGRRGERTPAKRGTARPGKRPPRGRR